MNVKLFIYGFLNFLPNWFLGFLIRINKNPNWIFGNVYRANFELLKKGGLRSDEIERLLLDMCNFAVANVPFYRDRYTKVDSLQEFQAKFGFIDKDLVNEFAKDFLTLRFNPRNFDLQTTSGTSGKPLSIYQPKNRYQQELAMVHFAWSAVGYQFDERAVLRNHRLPKEEVYRINPITKELQFDNFNNSDTYFRSIYNVLLNREVKYIHAYPSAAYQFALFCKKSDLSLNFVKAFLCSSENILAEHRSLIEGELGIKIMGFYGHTEKLVFAYNCTKSDSYHVEGGYGYCELINDMGESVIQVGEMGEICGTTLTNFGMPLIRYRTGDFAVYEGNTCPHCGVEKLTLRRILGRWNGDFIDNLDGTKVSLTALNLHGEIYTHILGLQYFHPQPGYLEIWVIKSLSFNEKHARELLSQIEHKFNPDMKVVLKYVSELKMKENGKFVQLIREF